MLAQMTYAGVDHAVLQAGGAYGAMTSYNAHTQTQYPQQFTGLLHFDEPMGGTADGLAEVERGPSSGSRASISISRASRATTLPGRSTTPASIRCGIGCRATISCFAPR